MFSTTRRFRHSHSIRNLQKSSKKVTQERLYVMVLNQIEERKTTINIWKKMVMTVPVEMQMFCYLVLGSGPSDGRPQYEKALRSIHMFVAGFRKALISNIWGDSAFALCCCCWTERFGN